MTSADFDIRDYGAVGDGTTRNTAAIQRAIDACAAAGGGRVTVAGGTYMTGTVTLHSFVELHIAANGVLLGSPRCEDYPERQGLRHVQSELLPRRRNACLIFAEECENIAITGTGTIDGNGEHFVEKVAGKRTPYQRIDAPTPPRVVFFAGCRNVTVTDVTMQNQPAGWSYWIHDCEFVSFSRIKILARLDYPNNDGIHINCSRNVAVSDSFIRCGDDAIVVRANSISLAENKVCERVTVTNCSLTTLCNGIRVGWINDGTIRDCAFSNLVMTDTADGIQVELPKRETPERMSDEGREATRIENLTFSNIVMDRIYSYPVIIRISDDAYTHCETVRNLYFNGLHSHSTQFPLLTGRKDCPIKNISFTDCTFEKIPPLSREEQEKIGAVIPQDRASYTIEIRHAEQVSFTDTVFTALE